MRPSGRRPAACGERSTAHRVSRIATAEVATQEDMAGDHNVSTPSAPAPDPEKKKAREPAEIEIRSDWCKGCEFCVMFCPKHVLQMEGVLPKVIDATSCTRCLICESVCPDFAIRVR
jgi:2-oxoglutarate ferredoxin oxidoreductase subunit delta